jgi:23S rRNA pseudouridine2605 synthase
MTEKTKKKSAAQAAKRASALRKAPAKIKGADAKPKRAAAAAKTVATKPAKAGTAARAKAETKTKAKPVAGSATKQISRTSETTARTKSAAASKRKAKKTAEETFAGYRLGEPVLDPIGDTTDGEGRAYTGKGAAQGKVEMEAFRADTNLAATDSGIEAGRGLEAARAAAEERAREAAEEAAARDKVVEDESESEAKAPGPAKLERLQKILSQAGIASRRHAEEMIVAGRVMVNGEVVTQLGSKADPARDHIRVDGKLLHGAERHRYFMLNKPKGYVTTVSDPEGRPTVMQFFAKMHERVYPVGRLDFQSEGLLLMTNDGELANLITRAESGVEKTYLVKVAGQPDEDQLERLRGGVAIERGETGSERVRTAPARIQQVRRGDNPWYEVVLTEGRNRELRKMFASIGHFAEKIRRVGYGPLVLDVEPGKLRELRPEEVQALRLAAEGKIKPRRIHADRMLPKEAGTPAETRNKFRERRNQTPNTRFARPAGGSGYMELREKKAWGSDNRPQGRREDQPQKKEWRPRDREFRERSERKPFGGGEGRERGGAQFQGGNRPFSGGSRSNPGLKGETWGTRKPSQFGGRPAGQRPFGGKPQDGKPPFEPRFSGNAGRERREGHFDGERRKPFPQRGDRPPFERGARPSFKPDGEQKRPFRSDRGKSFGSDRGKSFGDNRGKSFGAKFGAKPGGFTKPHGEGGTSKRFGADRGKSFGADRSKSFGKSFASGPKFGAKSGGGGQFRSEGSRNRKPGFGRPGARPGGWKRG